MPWVGTSAPQKNKLETSSANTFIVARMPLSILWDGETPPSHNWVCQSLWFVWGRRLPLPCKALLGEMDSKDRQTVTEMGDTCFSANTKGQTVKNWRPVYLAICLLSSRWCMAGEILSYRWSDGGTWQHLDTRTPAWPKKSGSQGAGRVTEEPLLYWHCLQCGVVLLKRHLAMFRYSYGAVGPHLLSSSAWAKALPSRISLYH